MGCCGSGVREPGTYIVWDKEVKCKMVVPFEGGDATIRKPSPCNIEEQPRGSLPVPALEFAVKWDPASLKVVSGGGDAAWNADVAKWVSKVLTQKLPNLYSGREQVLYAGLLPKEAKQCLILTSTGAMFMLNKKGLVNTWHVIQMTKIDVQKDPSGDLLTLDITSTLPKEAPPALQPKEEAKQAKEVKGPLLGAKDCKLALTTAQAQALIGKIKALRSVWKGAPLDVKVPEFQKDTFGSKTAAPGLPADGGFCCVFFAVCSSLGVPMVKTVQDGKECSLRVGTALATGVPMLECDISSIVTLGGANVFADVQVAYALQRALLQTGHFVGLTCRKKNLGANHMVNWWGQLLPIFRAGRLLKLQLLGCGLTGTHAADLFTALNTKGANTIVDLDLSENPAMGSGGGQAVAVQVAKMLETASGGVRRLALSGCGLKADAKPLLDAIGSKGSKIEYLDLSGNEGLTFSPNPLAGLWKFGALEVLDVSGTGMDIEALVDCPGALKVKSFKELYAGGAPVAAVQRAPAGPKLTKFFSELGPNFSYINIGDALNSPQSVSAFLSGVGKLTSPNLQLDLSGADPKAKLLESLAEAGKIPASCCKVGLPASAAAQGTETLFDKLEISILQEFIATADKEGPAADKQKTIAANAMTAMFQTPADIEKAKAAGKVLGGVKKLDFSGEKGGSKITVALQSKDQIADKCSVQADYVGVGPGLAPVLAGLSESKDLQELDITGCVGGDGVGVTLGAVLLRTNRSIRSVLTEGNYFSQNGWGAIRGAFYGNTKVVDFPFPETDASKRIAQFQSKISRNNGYVLECRARIKRAYKSTKGARTPYVMKTQEEEVEKIKTAKVQNALMLVSVKKFGLMQAQIQEAVSRNQRNAKNKQQFEKAQNKANEKAWKDASKALEKADQLQKKRMQKLQESKAKVAQERANCMKAWQDKVAELKKAKKDVSWFETWCKGATVKKEDGTDGPSMITGDNADLLLALVPDDLKSKCKDVIKKTEALQKLEEEVNAEAALLEVKAIEQKGNANAAMKETNNAKPPPKYNNLSNAPKAGTVVPPPASLVKPPPPAQGAAIAQGIPVQQANPSAKVQAAKWEQFKVYQNQQTQAAVQFNQQQAGASGSGFQKQNNKNSKQMAMAAAGGGAVVGGGFLGAYMYSHHRNKYYGGYHGHSYYNDPYGYYGYYGYGYHDPYYYGYNDYYYDDYDYNDHSNVVVEDSAKAEEIPVDEEAAEAGASAEEAAEAGDAVGEYGGGEDQRPGGGPRPSGSPKVRAVDRWMNPTPPRLDLREWFEEKIRGAQKAAWEAVMGRKGPLPCHRETFLRTNDIKASDTATAPPPLICLVTQCSVDRMDRFQVQLESWDGELSAAVYIDAHPESLTAAEARCEVMQTCSRAAAARAAKDPNAALPEWTITVVYRLRDEEMTCPAYDQLYPVNTLRNVALAGARAELVFLLDVDFVPSRGLYTRLCGNGVGSSSAKLCGALRTGGGPNGRPVALVVPAFEVIKSGVPTPQDSTTLAAAYAGGKVEGFHIKRFPKGHRATDFARWFARADADVADVGGLTAKTHGIDTYPVEYEESFEPYVVVAKSFVPAYDERFRGYGMNKISHLYSLAAHGFHFHVVDSTDAFVVAQKHVESKSWQLIFGEDADSEHRARLSVHWADFKAELRTTRGAKPMQAHDAPAGEAAAHCESTVSDPLAGLQILEAEGDRVENLTDFTDPEGPLSTNMLLLADPTIAILAAHLSERCARLEKTLTISSFPAPVVSDA